MGEESSLLQLIDNANQALEYWKQIYDRYLEKRKLLDHRSLLEKELLWSTESKLSKSLQSVEEKVSSKSRTLEDLKSQQADVSAEGEKTHKALLDKQVELGKLYYSLVRAESERAKDEATRTTFKSLKEDIEGLSKSVDELLGIAPGKTAKRLRELVDYIAKKGRGRRGGRGEAEDRTRQRGLLAPAGDQPDRGADQEDHGGLHLPQGEVRSALLQDQDHRVRPPGAGEERQGVQGRAREAEAGAREGWSARSRLRGSPTRSPRSSSSCRAHLQKMQDIPDDAEKIYNDYSGNIEELKVKLTKLQENKKDAPRRARDPQESLGGSHWPAGPGR